MATHGDWKDGMKYKFLVLKWADIEELDERDRIALDGIMATIEQNRRNEGKEACPEYIVVNTDESYAEQVADIMKANGHWG